MAEVSLDPILFAMKDAPVADVEEWAVLVAMAESADEDGCNAFQSTATLAERTRLHERTVQRRIDAMVERRVLVLGDQEYVKLLRLPPDKRPVNYDVAIPFEWWGNIGRVNAWRAGEGRPPLTAQDRPPLPPAPAKKRRADAKKPATERGDYKSPRAVEPSGVTASPERGDYKSPRGVTCSHPTPPSTHPSNPPPPPAPTTAAPTATAGGGGGRPIFTTDEALAEFVAELRRRRREVDRPVTRWTKSAVVKAMHAAAVAGFAWEDMPGALRALADDPATEVAGRLSHSGPWWDADEVQAARARRAAQEQPARQSGCDACEAGWVTVVEVGRFGEHEAAQRCPACNSAA